VVLHQHHPQLKALEFGGEAGADDAVVVEEGVHDHGYGYVHDEVVVVQHHIVDVPRNEDVHIVLHIGVAHLRNEGAHLHNEGAHLHIEGLHNEVLLHNLGHQLEVVVQLFIMKK
jgi:hypothetical protein